MSQGGIRRGGGAERELRDPAHAVLMYIDARLVDAKTKSLKKRVCPCVPLKNCGNITLHTCRQKIIKPNDNNVMT